MPTQTDEAMTIDMERALLGCTVHVSGVLVTWNRAFNDGQLEVVGRGLIERSNQRLKYARETGNDRNALREEMLIPFIRHAFGVK